MEISKFDIVADFIKTKTNADDVKIEKPKKLSGGAIQENWAIDIIINNKKEETIEAVFRCDSPSILEDSLSRAEEFALLEVAFKNGVTVPKPLWLADQSVIGFAFFIMKRVSGTAAGHILVKNMDYAPNRTSLTKQLGIELAKIHSIKPTEKKLNFLPKIKEHPAIPFLEESESFLDEREGYEGLKHGLKWLKANLPKEKELCLVHRDFRTGNYMVDKNGLTAILDWEFTTWSYPEEDIGWLCARCWRFGKNNLEVGGVGDLNDLIEGYASVPNAEINKGDLFYWQVFAHFRWAIIAIRQGERHFSGKEDNLELALTAHIVPEVELELIRMIGIDFLNAERIEKDIKILAEAKEQLNPTISRVLKQKVLPKITGKEKFELLMSINALNIASRNALIHKLETKEVKSKEEQIWNAVYKRVLVSAPKKLKAYFN